LAKSVCIQLLLDRAKWLVARRAIKPSFVNTFWFSVRSGGAIKERPQWMHGSSWKYVP